MPSLTYGRFDVEDGRERPFPIVRHSAVDVTVVLERSNVTVRRDVAHLVADLDPVLPDLVVPRMSDDDIMREAVLRDLRQQWTRCGLSSCGQELSCGGFLRLGYAWLRHAPLGML